MGQGQKHLKYAYTKNGSRTSILRNNKLPVYGCSNVHDAPRKQPISERKY